MVSGAVQKGQISTSCETASFAFSYKKHPSKPKDKPGHVVPSRDEVEVVFSSIFIARLTEQHHSITQFGKKNKPSRKAE